MPRAIRTLAAVFILAADAPWAVAAAQGTPGADARAPWREVWAGAIASPRIWSAYSGVTYAPFGAVTQDGFRLRSVGGYGQYRYSYARGASNMAFRGVNAFTDLLAGYQLTLGPATIKLLAGGSAMGHLLSGYDPENRVQGLDYGLKVGIESWWNLGPSTWAQFDGSWTAAFSSVNARARAGYRVLPDVSLGFEISASSNAQLRSEWLSNEPWRGASGGAFARYEWSWGEVSASGGLGSQGGSGAGMGSVDLGPHLGSVAKPTAPYGTLNWLARF